MLIHTIRYAWIKMLNKGWTTYGELLDMSMSDYRRLWEAALDCGMFNDKK